MVTLLIAILTVILGSALCSGSEAALFSVPQIKVRQLAENNARGARTLLKIRENMSRPIATIVILNNIFNIVGSIVVGGIAASVLGDQWLGLFSGALTMAVIIGAEIVPKTIGERYAEPIALVIAAPIAGLTWVMMPLVWLVEKIVSPVTGGKPQMAATSEAEIKLLAQLGQQEGSIEGDEALLILRAFHLNDVTAGDLMTPRVSVTYVHGSATLADARDVIIASPHTRILVIGDSIDEIVGFARKDELLVAIIQGQVDQLLAELSREVRFVPKTVQADKLLTTFQKSREHLAVVVDEYGGTAGVVTLEDVLEELTGEIVDETDKVVDLQKQARERLRTMLSQNQE
ncbi:MAG: HlyC/CorC family transporter [Chloroflexaceae bacterium]|nr:HlyC/CorC family transporter [Chloroflexaceae bacterium]